MALIKLGAGAYKAGSVIQVQSTLITTASSQSISANNNANITNLNVSITPTSTSSKIFLLGRLFYEANDTEHDSGFYFNRGSTPINVATNVGSRSALIATAGINYYDSDMSSTPQTVSFYTVDSPSTTSATTYHLAFKNTYHGANKTVYINQTVGTNDSSNYERGSSEIIAMEIAG